LVDNIDNQADFYVTLYDGAHYLMNDGESVRYMDIDRSLISTETWAMNDLDQRIFQVQDVDWYGCRLVYVE